MTQRNALAKDIGCTTSYLNGLNVTTRKPSILMVYRIYKSDINKGLVKGKRFTKPELIEYVEWHLEASNNEG
jgi:hypothetical protein